MSDLRILERLSKHVSAREKVRAAERYLATMGLQTADEAKQAQWELRRVFMLAAPAGAMALQGKGHEPRKYYHGRDVGEAAEATPEELVDPAYQLGFMVCQSETDDKFSQSLMVGIDGVPRQIFSSPTWRHYSVMKYTNDPKDDKPAWFSEPAANTRFAIGPREFTNQARRSLRVLGEYAVLETLMNFFEINEVSEEVEARVEAQLATQTTSG